MDTLEDEPAPLDGDTVSYFISDGEPTYGMHEDTYWSWDDWAYVTGYVRDGDGRNETDVNDDIVNDWLALGIDKMYSVGIGDDSLTTYLDEISDSSDDVIIVNDANDLDSTLSDTVVVETGSLDFSFGADGAADGSGIKLDGGNLAFTWETPSSTGNDASSISWSVNGTNLIGTIAGQTVIKVEATEINSDNPQYKITELSNELDINNISFPYTITDGDGDSMSANLDVTITKVTPTAIVTLNDVNVEEGSGVATIGATLNHTPDTDFIVTLSNGSTVTFGTDYVPGTIVESTEFNIQEDDVYVVDESYDVTISGSQG
eukprot:TRINITY_DN24104_c0_g2_i1.p2 TRINITY_DN24104_c0_g2~~TRINITY_DN24104_c0_g2_i1.p2  ORF type:complete len:359 (+),score=14.83 TRINITY_DN24104_c0_g2_i1:124-1077(+)